MEEFGNEINKVLTSVFGLDLINNIIHYEVIYKKNHRDKYESAKAEYEQHLRNHPKKEEISKRLYVSDDFILHITYQFSRSEVEGLHSKSLFYYPICTYDEIKRIENISNTEDYLLKTRADCVAEHARIARVFLNRRNADLENWSLTSFYDSYDFDEYKSRLPAEMSLACNEIAAGYILSREPHGACINTEYGKVIVVSENLKHFLFYMNAHFKGGIEDLDEKDTSACIFIACRTMLLTESPDFDLDPRGELPIDIKQYCDRVVDDQVQFIIGHEYAHALLGHFGTTAQTTAIPELLLIQKNGDGEKFFTPRQQQEFEADAGSILHANYSDEECSSTLNGAVLFFLYIDIFYSVSDYINPPFNPSKTHPDPIDRLWALRAAVLGARSVDRDTLYTDAQVEDWIYLTQSIKTHLVSEVLPFCIDDLERYGSIYLPSYRENNFYDRFDF